MRIILLIIFLIPSFVFAAVGGGVCPAGSSQIGGIGAAYPEPKYNDIVGSACTGQMAKCITVSNGSEQFWNGSSFVTVKAVLICLKPLPVTCNPATHVTTAGEYGVNYSCQPIPCPASHPTAAGGQCKDSNGCNQDQSFTNGVCVNKKIEDIAARCMAAAGQSQVATITVPSDGSGATCSIGGTVGMGTVPNCTTAPGGTACVVSQLAPGDKTGMQCGSFNGASVCVASSETNAIGTSTKAPGTSTASGTPKTIEEQVSEMGQTTTTIKTTTPETTTTTAVNDGSAMQEGQQMDGGAGASPMPPIVCSNGMRAANMQSCDTAVTCPSDSYIAYGVCIKMPTRSTVTAKDSTVTTVTVKNDSTGQTVSETSSTSSVSIPVKNPSAPGTAETQRSGQCDPTAKNYQECVGLITSVADTYLTDQRTTLDAAGTTQADLYKTTRQNDINSLTTDGLGVSTASNRNAVNPLLFASSACQPYSFSFLGRSVTIGCDFSDKVKAVLYWFFYLLTLHQLFVITFRPRSAA